MSYREIKHKVDQSTYILKVVYSLSLLSTFGNNNAQPSNQLYLFIQNISYNLRHFYLTFRRERYISDPPSNSRGCREYQNNA